MNVRKTLFAQVMEYVPWKTFGRIIDRYGGDAGVRTLDCANLFRVMAFSQLTWRESLRDIESCLAANQTKLFHMGLSGVPARATLSDALAMRLIVRARNLYTKEPTGLELDATVYALDSTTIDLCLSLFDWAPFRSTKAAVKMHTLLDLRGAIPAFIHISDGKMADVKVLDILPIEAGAFYVMDRGYLDFGRLFKLHQAGAFFVTRAKRGMNARRVYSVKTERTSGVVCDQSVRLSGYYVSRDYPEHLRRIRYKDPESGKTLVFLTNNTSLPPLTIAALYKSRWQVELFFKWIKQHLRIKRFLGTSENAVKTQIWCAVSTYVLIAIVKKELHLNASLYTLLQILSVSIFEKTLISCALQPDTNRTIMPTSDNQLNLFEI
ncbi:MAG: IS4 family transposase [Methylotenera sp.]|nr:IS4 family transposase [Methylotenera sp.]MDP2403084.1 IS4 family transposase [Methylotenera sp.]MDP3096127.1 IS4 family transposase [Methylotenera sp.]MDZ4223042.1 IS4 family transposase [Methylotenera sp.]